MKGYPPSNFVIAENKVRREEYSTTVDPDPDPERDNDIVQRVA